MTKNAQKQQQAKAMKTKLRIKNPCKNAVLKAIVNKGYDIDVQDIEAYYPHTFLD